MVMESYLSDRFERRVTYLRLSVTDRCNYRCVYCMPAAGIDYMPHRDLLSFEEIETIVRALAAVGVRRVRLTGGEPLVRRDLSVLVEKLCGIPGIDEVVMTTNAHILERHIGDLVAAGLSGINISLDSLKPDRFAEITRGGDVGKVIAGIEAAKEAGLGPKLNAVAIRNVNHDELLDLVRFSIERGVVLRFIEFMPIGAETIWPDAGCLPAADIRAELATRYRLEAEPFKNGRGPARYWRLFGADAPPEGHRVGIIAAVTECFCSDCNRIRLTSQGGLRACLADDREVDLRDILRSGGNAEDLRAAVRRALFAKNETHAFVLGGGNVTEKQMVSIGG
jgi:cyclic pyranopterin phosphate synthase